jgi:hypothetical protein
MIDKPQYGGITEVRPREEAGSGLQQVEEMTRPVSDRIRAAFLSVCKNIGLGQQEPVVQRVENARMSQTRLKALDKATADEIIKGGKRNDLFGLSASDSGDPVSKIKSMSGLSHYRLQALAVKLPVSFTIEQEEFEISDSEFIDPKERRARELAEKYC